MAARSDTPFFTLIVDVFEVEGVDVSGNIAVRENVSIGPKIARIESVNPPRNK